MALNPAMKSLSIILYLLAAFICSLPAHADSVDARETTAHPIGKSIRYLPETNGPMALDEVVSAYAAGRFQQSDSAVLNFGIGADPVWVGFDVVNAGTDAVLRRLSLQVAWLDHVDVYFRNDGKTSASFHVGDALPFQERPVEDRYFAFDHVFTPGTTRMFIRVQSPDPLVLPIYLLSERQAQRNQTFEDYSYGLLYGAIFSLLAYNFMLFVSLRSSRYLFYSVYLAAFLLMNVAYTGHGYRWLWPASPHWQSWAPPVLMMVCAVSGLVFASRFLNTASYFPRLHRAVMVICLSVAVMELFAVILANQELGLLVAFTFVFVYSIGMVLLGAISLAVGNKSAKYFLVASVTHATLASVTALAVWGIIPYSTLAYRAYEIGMVLDAALLAMALADQFRLNQEAKVAAERLAKVDPLTGMNNRRAFYDLVRPIWSSSLRKRHPMAVVIMDIDRFKQLNDTYGHAYGDEVLQQMSATLREGARTGDILARWGGEEFLLFLNETSLDEALVIAERFRQRISTTQLVVEGGVIYITASFGVAHTEGAIITIDDLIAEADGHLYAAKEQGRNRVCSPRDSGGRGPLEKGAA